MKIQSTIAGFAGEPCTLVGSLDDRTGVLVIVKQIRYREERIDPSFALVTNLDLPELDLHFRDDHLSETIRVYYTRKAQMTMDLLPEVRRYEPDNKIEQESVDEGGRRYRIAPDIQNGQIAVLAAVALVQAQTGFKAAVEMADELSDFYRVETI